MPVLQYKILSPTLALFREADRTVARPVPAGSVIQIESQSFVGNKLVHAIWDGKEIMIFAQDVRSRGEKVE